MRCSLRSIPRHLGRSPSTVSREVQRNGGADRYRAAGSDQAAWDRAPAPQALQTGLPSVLEADSINLAAAAMVTGASCRRPKRTLSRQRCRGDRAVPSGLIPLQRIRHSDRLMPEPVASHLPPPSKHGLLRSSFFRLHSPPRSTWRMASGRDFPFSRALHGYNPPYRASILTLAKFRWLPCGRRRRFSARLRRGGVVYSKEVESARLARRLRWQKTDGAAWSASICLSLSTPALQARGWLLRLARLVTFMTFSLCSSARVHSPAPASIVPSACGDCADN